MDSTRGKVLPVATDPADQPTPKYEVVDLETDESTEETAKMREPKTQPEVEKSPKTYIVKK